MLSQEEGRRLGHNYVGTDFILLGLIHQEKGQAARILKSKGMSLVDARIAVEKRVGRGPGNLSIETPFTDQAKRMLEKSWEISQEIGHNYICTEHLLAAILETGDGGNAGDEAVGVLSIFDVNTNELRTEAKEAAKNRPPAPQPKVEPFKHRVIELRSTDQLDSAIEKARDVIWHVRTIAIQAQDFELAAWLRETETELNARIKKTS